MCETLRPIAVAGSFAHQHAMETKLLYTRRQQMLTVAMTETAAAAHLHTAARREHAPDRRRLSPAGQDVDHHCRQVGAFAQRLLAGSLHRRQTVAEHRSQDAHICR